MTVSISNMAQVWMSNTNTYNGIAMSVSTLGYGANASSRILKLSVDGNTSFSIDANGASFQKTFTAANLPNANSSGAGTRTFVTDANTKTFLNIVYGGGTNTVPVFSNGNYWLIG